MSVVGKRDRYRRRRRGNYIKPEETRLRKKSRKNVAQRSEPSPDTYLEAQEEVLGSSLRANILGQISFEQVSRILATRFFWTPELISGTPFLDSGINLPHTFLGATHFLLGGKKFFDSKSR